MTNPTHPQALLWDLDGTLIDSERYWMKAEAELAAAYDIPWGEAEALALVGIDMWDGARRFREQGVTMEADDIVDHLTNEVMKGIRNHIPFRPGALELLTEALDAGVPNALVTMSISSLATAVAEALEAQLGRTTFGARITGDMVDFGKPHPEPYLRGAAALDVPIEHCVVIEDSFPGVRSGIASGAVVIGVPHAADIRELQGPAEIWESLDGRGLADVAAVYRDRTGA